jgi:hypothetical protein
MSYRHLSDNSNAPARGAWRIAYDPGLFRASFSTGYRFSLITTSCMLVAREALTTATGWHQTASEARLLSEGALEKENILDLPETQRPEVANDRGGQLKAKLIQCLCEEHGTHQLFARDWLVGLS